MHACKRRRQHASYVPRKRNPYTRAPGVFLSFSLIPLTQSTCPYAITISLQRARESRKGKSRCERVRRSYTFASADMRCAHARERMDGEKARFPLFVNCARQARQKSKLLRARTAAVADLLQMQRDRRRVQRLPRLHDTRTSHTYISQIARITG